MAYRPWLPGIVLWGLWGSGACLGSLVRLGMATSGFLVMWLPVLGHPFNLCSWSSLAFIVFLHPCGGPPFSNVWKSHRWDGE